jgi:hypothetical protein
MQPEFHCGYVVVNYRDIDVAELSSFISEIDSIGLRAVTTENPHIFMVRASKSSC